MLLKFVIFFLCSTFVKCDLTRATNKVQLIDSANYMLNVTQQFIYELEEYGLCNTKLADMNQSISRDNYFGYEIKGEILYRNGFLYTFQEVTLEQEPQDASIDQKNNSAHMSMKLIFSSLIFYYDYHANLTKGYFSGTVEIPINNMRATLYVDKYFTNNILEYRVEITGYGPAAIVRKWYYEPSNHYTEIINKDIMLDLDYKLIEDLWTKLLGMAIQKFTYPEMCFIC